VPAPFHVITPTDRVDVLDLVDAYRAAFAAIGGGCPWVEITRRKTEPDCWGPPTGCEGLLHRFEPAVYSVAPAGGVGSTATFPPYAWRLLHQASAPAAAVEPTPAPVEAPPEAAAEPPRREQLSLF
jgi:hypothetical protein